MICPIITLVILVMFYPCNAGDPKPKITGGKEVNPPHKFPWIVSMQYTKNSLHLCIGSIFNKYWIVTSYNCARGHVEIGFGGYKWVTGLHNWSAPDPVWSQSVNPVAVVVHPTATKDDTMGNIAMIKVEPAIIFNARVAPANFINYDFNNYSNVNYTATLAGWGPDHHTEESLGPGLPNITEYAPYFDILHEVEHRVYTLESCQRWASWHQFNSDQNRSRPFTEDHICGGGSVDGSEEAGFCTDFGGPLMVYDEATLLWTVIGIASWGTSDLCNDKGARTIYARTSRYYRWMVQVTRSCVARSVVGKNPSKR